eukprot:4993064-Prymnesium_polylepis.1
MAACRRVVAAARRASTLASPVEVAGVGLHSGASSRVVLRPAAPEDGIYFVRRGHAARGCGAEARIAARPERVVDTRLCTVLGAAGSGGASVSTVEHLMAALCGSGVMACRVEVDAPELPLLDGSASPWVDAIRAAGLVSAGGASTAVRPSGASTDASSPRPRRPVCVEEAGAWVIALPAAAPRLTYGIEFAEHAPIGRQWFSWAPGDGSSFADEVAPARTFALREQIDGLRAAGLIKGGTLDNALVCERTRWLNGPLRFANEPARHKLLDLMGDLALLGGLPPAHVVAFRASHRLHVRLALALAAEWELCGATT